MTTEAGDVVVRVEGLFKTFHIGFFRKRVDAVRGVSFEVRRGEIFGLLGPNGAGKTTTIKTLLGLIFPTSGKLELFGKPHDSIEARARLGYMPENPYVYQYLKAGEFLDLCGRLSGMSASDRRTRIGEILERVGLSHAVDRPIGRFSKGMTQRVGLAQALLHDPEVLVLDEPMSGLDPIGRKEVRDILLEQRARGKTLLFTSHILSDVERLCDRVAIIDRGVRRSYGKMGELLKADAQFVEIELDGVGEELRRELVALGGELREVHRHTLVVIKGEERVSAILGAAIARGAKVLSVTSKRETLEDVFVRNAMSSDPGAERRVDDAPPGH